MSNLIEFAKTMRAYIEKASTVLEDGEALKAIYLFPQWKENTLYQKNDRVRYNNVLYRCLQEHISQNKLKPDLSLNFWNKVIIKELEEWKESNIYQIGDKVLYNNIIYESIIANNIWSPDSYPTGWKNNKELL